MNSLIIYCRYQVLPKNPLTWKVSWLLFPGFFVSLFLRLITNFPSHGCWDILISFKDIPNKNESSLFPVPIHPEYFQTASHFQNFKVPKLQKFKVSKFQNCNIPHFQNFNLSKVSQLQDFRSQIPNFQKCWYTHVLTCSRFAIFTFANITVLKWFEIMSCLL